MTRVIEATCVARSNSPMPPDQKFSVLHWSWPSGSGPVMNACEENQTLWSGPMVRPESASAA